MTSPAMTAETIELLQTLIRNGCINDGTPSRASSTATPTPSTRSSATPGSTWSASSRPKAGRRSSPAWRAPTRRAPSLCLMGHTDVVPVNPEGWSRDPFGGELSRRARCGDAARSTCSTSRRRWRSPSASSPREGSGREATSSTSPSPTRSRAAPRAPVDGRPPARRHPGRLRAHRERRTALGAAGGAVSGVNVGEKGVAWRRLRVRGTPGHGSVPFRSRQRAGEGRGGRAAARRLPPGAAGSTSCGASGSRRCGVDEELAAALLDPARVDAVLAAMPTPAAAATSTPARTRRSRRTWAVAAEDERDPRLHRHRGRHPHAPGRRRRRGAGPPRRGARRPRRTGRGRDPHERPGEHQPHRHPVVGQPATGGRSAVPDGSPHAAAHRRLHRFTHLPARWVPSRTAPALMSPTSTRRVRPAVPRQRREGRRRIAGPHPQLWLDVARDLLG